MVYIQAIIGIGIRVVIECMLRLYYFIINIKNILSKYDIMRHRGYDELR